MFGIGSTSSDEAHSKGDKQHYMYESYTWRPPLHAHWPWLSVAPGMYVYTQNSGMCGLWNVSNRTHFCSGVTRHMVE